MTNFGNSVRTIVWLLPPSRLKNAILRILGHSIHPTARAGIALVWRTRDIRVGPDAKIGNFVVVKHLERLSLEEGCSLGGWNLVSSSPIFGALYPNGAQLEMRKESAITTRHTLDCSGGIYLGAFSLVAGHGTEILTHSINLEMNAQAAYLVKIGERSFVGSRCIILGGAELPARCVLAAGSTLLPAREDSSQPDGALYAGVPAAPKGKVGGAWFERTQEATRDVFLPSEGKIFPNAF